MEKEKEMVSPTTNNNCKEDILEYHGKFQLQGARVRLVSREPVSNKRGEGKENARIK